MCASGAGARESCEEERCQEVQDKKHAQGTPAPISCLPPGKPNQIPRYLRHDLAMDFHGRGVGQQIANTLAAKDLLCPVLPLVGPDASKIH